MAIYITKKKTKIIFGYICPYMAINCYIWPYMQLYMAIYGNIHTKIRIWGVWTYILGVWTCILGVWTCLYCCVRTCILGVWICLYVTKCIFFKENRINHEICQIAIRRPAMVEQPLFFQQQFLLQPYS